MEVIQLSKSKPSASRASSVSTEPAQINFMVLLDTGKKMIVTCDHYLVSDQATYCFYDVTPHVRAFGKTHVVPVLTLSGAAVIAVVRDGSQVTLPTTPTKRKRK